MSKPYVPTNDELGDEVADIIIEHFTPSPRDILEFLQKQRPGWKVPEQRVAKYMEEYTDLRRGIHKQETSSESRVPPKPPTRTFSEESNAEEKADEAVFTIDDDDDDDDDESDPDSELEAEADKRTSFMAKGGSYSIQKVLKGEARAKKGVTRFDRRRIQSKKDSSESNGNDDIGNADEADGVVVDEPLGESYTSYNSEQTDGDGTGVDDEDDEDAEEFEAEVARRSKFIAKGGSHSIKKVLNGEARSAGTAGPARLDRRRIAARGDDDDGAPKSKVPPKTPLRSISVDSTDSQIEDEASRRSLFMLKGASHSIRKLFEGNTKKADSGLDRIGRRKSHFKKESDAVHYAEKPHMKPQEINEARLKGEADIREKAAKRKAAMKMPRRPTKPSSAKKPEPENDDDIEEDDAELEAEADRRTLMFKGGSHSIRNLFAGNTKKSGSGLNRFNRRKMSLRKEADAVHYGEKPHLNPNEINARHKQEAARLRDTDDDDNIDVGDEESKEAVDAEIERLHGDTDDDDEDLDAEDADIEAEADKRTSFMAKGGSYSIQKILKGEARAKKGVSRFDRRQMGFKKEAQAIHSHDKKDESKKEEPSETPSESEQEIVFKNEEDSTTNDAGDDELFDEDEDKEIVEEADRRASFMAKGGSYSIQKILKGEARVKKGVSRFDRRQMHFKKESEAMHKHDHDREMAKSAPNDHVAKPPTRKSSTCDNSADDSDSDSDLDEEDKELLAQVDSRHMMMLKGASHSIRNIFAGKTKHTEEPADNMHRRTSRLRKASVTQVESRKKAASLAPQPDPVVDDDESDDEEEDDPTDSVHDDDEEMDFRQRFSLKGASHSIRNLLSGKARRNSSAIDDEIERLAGQSNDDADMDDEDREIEEEADKRSSFIAKGGSYSITKVLSGNARKKSTGITRFDRRKMHFKKESEAIHSHDHDGGGDGEDQEYTEKDHREQAAVDDDSEDDEGAEDADIEEEADRRSSFILKGASYSIQKVLSGTARKPANTTVSRLDRRKMHFKKESGHKAPSSEQTGTKAAATRQVDDHEDDQERVEDTSEFEEEDADLLAQIDDRAMMMLKGASHSIRNLFSGNTKMHQHDNEGTGLNRRLSRMKQSPRNSKGSSDLAASAEQAEQTEKTHGSSGETTMETSGSSDAERKALSNNADADDDDEEDEEIDFRKRFSLKGASHSIKKVLAGTARSSTKSSTPTQVTRLDRRKMAFRKPSGGSGSDA